MTRISHRITLLASLAAFAAGAMLACTEAPFEPRNPFDPAFELDVRIVALTDTLREVGQEALFQLVTDPTVHGYAALWTSDRPGFVSSLGHGRFRLDALPSAPTEVVVTGSYGRNRAHATLVVAP